MFLIFYVIVSGSRLQKKWKSLRGNYTREIKKLKNIGSGSETSKKDRYTHFKRLQFLQTSRENYDTKSKFNRINENLNNQDINEENMRTNTEGTDSNTETFKFPNDIRPKGKRIKLKLDDEMFANILEKSLEQKREHKIQEEDGDKLFCLSLYKEIKKVPESRRLKTKIEIYNIILKNQNIYPHQLQSQELPSASTCPSLQHRNYLSQYSLQSHNLASTSIEITSPATTNNSEESEIDLVEFEINSN